MMAERLRVLDERASSKAIPCWTQGNYSGTRPVVRHRRTKRRAIGPWGGGDSPEETASRARYIGSPEHKSYPSSAGSPALRSDATPCDPDIDRAEVCASLREAIRRRCTSARFEQGFPRYAWGWIAGDLYEARHINGPAGTYKGYRLEEAEHPSDPEHLLDWKISP